MLSRSSRTFLLLLIVIRLHGQNTEINRLVKSELEMTFPSIYFKHNSADYASMPYSVDSCFKYIAANLEDIVSYTIWRDSLETDALTKRRIKKLKADLNKFAPAGQVEIQSMGKEQKISRHTINKGKDKKQVQYLLSLNSVLDISKTASSEMGSAGGKKKWRYRTHIEAPRPWCWSCWKNGFHIKRRMQMKKVRRSKSK